MWEVLSRCAFLEHGLCLDLQEFQLDELVVGGEVSERSQVASRFVLASMVYQPSWGERHPYHSDYEDECWHELKADRYEPCGVGLGLEGGASDVVGSVVDPETDHDAECNSKLLQCNQSTTNLTETH